LTLKSPAGRKSAEKHISPTPQPLDGVNRRRVIKSARVGAPRPQTFPKAEAAARRAKEK
jgi:hypothetical protein